jgi:hypothetical protein
VTATTRVQPTWRLPSPSLMLDRDLLVLYAEALAADQHGGSGDVWRSAGIGGAEAAELIERLERRLRVDARLAERLDSLVANASAGAFVGGAPRGRGPGPARRNATG